MTEYKKVEYLYSDGTRNWEANILFDNIKRLEQENEKLRIQNSNFDNQVYRANEMINNCNSRLQEYKHILEKVREYILCYQECYEGTPDECINKIKEVLNDV